jgi:hypothetical protein
MKSVLLRNMNCIFTLQSNLENHDHPEWSKSIRTFDFSLLPGLNAMLVKLSDFFY